MLQKPAPDKQETAPAASLEDSFFRGIARTVRTYKLGDLLVNSGLISPEQLSKALTEQTLSGGQIGTILIHQQALNATQLYRTLAEQWCMKITAAGVAVLVQTAIPSPAQADEADGSSSQVATQFSQAATNRSVARQYPELFGTHETRSDNTTAFKKWMVMIDRFEAPLNSTAPVSEGVAAWRAEIASLKGLPRDEQIEKVNDFLNQVDYVDDRSAYGESGYWGASPDRFFSGGGDCKDYAIAKYASLRALGFTDKDLRIAVVQDKVKDIAHAILIFYSGDKGYVLDNQNKNIEPIEAVNRYQPYFSINSTSWWLHHA
jgi:predicted transglutaminase-like cysteine proteinase